MISRLSTLGMFSSLLSTKRQGNHDGNHGSMPLVPIGSSSLHELERIPTNTQCRCLPGNNTGPTLISATTNILNSSLSTQKLHKSTKSVSAFLCVFMHGFLVLLHLVLLALSISAVEHRLVTSENGAWMSVLGASTQAFYAVRLIDRSNYT